jgi:hypothetical protein
VTSFETYCAYLALKQHFSNQSYDYHKYNGKVNAKLQTFHKRKDRYFYERLSRNKNKKEIIDYFIANLVAAENPSKLWIGDLKGESGEEIYSNWIRRNQSLPYTFSEDLKKLTEEHHIIECLKSKNNTHPIIIKKFLKSEISIETLVILDVLLEFSKNLTELLSYDPVWKDLSLKIEKYKCFLLIDKPKYIKILKEIVL